MKNSEHYFSSSSTLDTLSSEEGASSISDSPLRMERIPPGNFLDEENLVESEEDETSSVDDDYVFNGLGMIFPGLDGTVEDSSPYGGYQTRERVDSEESEVSIDPPFDKERLQRSPTSTVFSMSPPDNSRHLFPCERRNETQAEWYQELIHFIRNGPPEPPQIDPNAPSLRDLIYGPNHVFENEVIGLAKFFDPSI